MNSSAPDATYAAPVVAAAPEPGSRPVAVVTGASSGIGAATARLLAAAGYRVLVAARRVDRIEALAAEIDGVAVACDVTDAEQVAHLAHAAGPVVHLLVNNAGGAFGAHSVAEAVTEDWRAMYEVNVIGLMQVTRALLPALKASGDGVIVNVGSTAGRVAYEGGGGYTAAKHGTKVVTETLRLELFDQPVRVCEVAPGMVKTDEFATVRFGGDTDKAAAVYAGVAEPLVAEDVADAIVWMATRPAHVNIDSLVIRPVPRPLSTRCTASEAGAAVSHRWVRATPGPPKPGGPRATERPLDAPNDRSSDTWALRTPTTGLGYS